MNDEQLLRYSRHILLPEIGIEGQEKLLCAPRARHRRGRARLAGRALSRFRRRRAASRSATATRSISPICSARSCTARNRSGSRRSNRRARRSREINPGDRGRRARGTARRRAARGARRREPTSCSTAATTSPPATPSTARASRTRKPLVSGAAVRFDGQVAVFDLRTATSPVLRVPVPGGRRVRGRALRGHGRVRAADRHHRHDPGGGGAEAPGRHRQDARRPAAAARCADHAVAHDAARRATRVRGVRRRPPSDSRAYCRQSRFVMSSESAALRSSRPISASRSFATCSTFGPLRPMHCSSRRAGKSPRCSGRWVSRIRAAFIERGREVGGLEAGLARLDRIDDRLLRARDADQQLGELLGGHVRHRVVLLQANRGHAQNDLPSRCPLLGPQLRRVALEAALRELVPAPDDEAQEQVGVRRLVGAVSESRLAATPKRSACLRPPRAGRAAG